MRRMIHFQSVMFTALALFVALGCVEEVPNPDLDLYDTSALALELDRITSELTTTDGLIYDDTNTRPNFDSEMFALHFSSDRDSDELSSDLSEDESVQPERIEQNVEIHYILAMWGRIDPQEGVRPIPLVWNPSLQVLEGDMVTVRRTVFFDSRDEVLPQHVRHQVDMISQTMPHVDGVVLQVALARSDASRPAYLRFRSVPVSIEVPASRLSNLDYSVMIDRAGNGLSLVSLEQDPVEQHCPSGFLAGRWIDTEERGGVFGGAWRTENGRIIGHVAGRYGVTSSGEQVFSGKYIDLDGRFKGILRGNYAEGQFRGEWLDADGDHRGYLRGNYGGSEDATRAGWFRGVWHETCPPLSDDDPSVDDERRREDGTSSDD